MHVCVVADSSYVSVWGWVLVHICTGMWTCVCMHVCGFKEQLCECVVVCTCMHWCVDMCVHACVVTESSYVYVGACTHMHRHVDMCVHACVCGCRKQLCECVGCLHMYTQACVCACMCVVVCTCMHRHVDMCVCVHVCVAAESSYVHGGGCLHTYTQACDVPVHEHVCAFGPLAHPEARSSAPDAAPAAFIANSIHQRRPPQPRQGRMPCYTEVLWFHSFIQKC